MNVDLLISEILARPPLWDRKDKNHHNRFVLDRLWNEVAVILKTKLFAEFPEGGAEAAVRHTRVPGAARGMSEGAATLRRRVVPSVERIDKLQRRHSEAIRMAPPLRNCEGSTFFRRRSYKVRYSARRIRFWQYGKWEDIYIDDLLPTYKGRQVFMHSKTPNEFWCALLEKAYAKLYGCYEALKGGNINEAMVDLTGGVVESVNIRESSKNLFKIMKEACNRGAMMGCGIEPDNPSAPSEGRLSNGLITRHAYSVTKVVKMKYGNREVELVRLHNPWGNEAEWKGSWSDKSPEWKSLNEETRNSLGIVFDDDGEFWMPYQDFVRNFTTMDICDVTPDVFTLCGADDICQQEQQLVRRQWKMKMFEGEWVPGVSAGGCRNFLDTFPNNPQRVVLLDKAEEGSKECTLVVSLMQKFVRQRKRYGVDFTPIGFAIYKLPPGVVPGKPLATDFFKYNASCGKSPYFLNTREVSYHYKFPPGVYVVIPSTFEPNEQAEFLLRIFTESYGSTKT